RRRGTGASDRLVRDLSRLKLSAKDIAAVSAAWKDYARSAGLAANSSQWTKAQQAQVRTWESNTIRALRHVKAEQRAFARAQAAAMAGPGMAGVGVAGAAAGRHWRRDAVTAAAAYGLPGTAGSLVGAGSAYMVGGAAGLGVAAAGAAAAYGVKQAVDFEKAMASVRKKVNLDEGATFADVEGMINKNARTFGIVRENMAELAATAGQAGVSYRDLAGFMQTAAKTSSAWDISAKDAAQTLAEVRAQTQWTNTQLADFADKVNFAGDISAAAEKDVGAMWQRAAAGAKAANVSYDDSLVALTALRSVGMDQEVAARFFGQFTSRLRTATSQGKDAAAAFKLLDTSAKAVEQGMKKDSAGTMLDVLDRIAKSKDGVKAALGIGGKEWFDEILRAKEARPEWVRLRDALATGAHRGSLDRSLKEDLATTNNHLERTKALTSEIGDKLMRWSLPPINTQLGRLLKGYETAQKTGFLPGPDGGPIDRLKDKTPVPFSEANRHDADAPRAAHRPIIAPPRTVMGAISRLFLLECRAEPRRRPLSCLGLVYNRVRALRLAQHS
ncbi:MAG: phage tail tape measure protein, partial [Methylocystis sp.]